MTESVAIVPRTPDEWRGLEMLGTVLAESKFFRDVHDKAQAVVKVIAGRELGLGPVESLRAFHIMDGKVEMSADLLAQRVKASERYDYRVVQLRTDVCELAFWERDDAGEWQSSGHSIFTIEDAKQAEVAFASDKGRPTAWTKFPRNMLFARAMSNGVAWFCPDVASGARVYVEGELGGPEPEQEWPLTPDPIVSVDGRAVDIETGEIVEEGTTSEGVASAVNPASQASVPEAAGHAAAEPGAKARDSRRRTEPVDLSPTKSAKPATKRQKQTLAILAANLGWDDDRRHFEAGVASFTDLDQLTAAHLIGRWEGLAAAEARLDNEPESYGEGDTDPRGSLEPTAAVDTHDHVWGPSKVSTLEICMVPGCIGTRDTRTGKYTT